MRPIFLQEHPSFSFNGVLELGRQIFQLNLAEVLVQVLGPEDELEDLLVLRKIRMVEEFRPGLAQVLEVVFDVIFLVSLEHVVEVVFVEPDQILDHIQIQLLFAHVDELLQNFVLVEAEQKELSSFPQLVADFILDVFVQVYLSLVRIVDVYEVVVWEQSCLKADGVGKLRQVIVLLIFRDEVLEEVLRKNSPQFVLIVSVHSQRLPKGGVFVPLAELAYLPHCIDVVVDGLKVGLHYQSPIVHQSIVLNCVEYFVRDVEGVCEYHHHIAYDFVLHLLRLLLAQCEVLFYLGCVQGFFNDVFVFERHFLLVEVDDFIVHQNRHAFRFEEFFVELPKLFVSKCIRKVHFLLLEFCLFFVGEGLGGALELGHSGNDHSNLLWVDSPFSDKAVHCIEELN